MNDRAKYKGRMAIYAMAGVYLLAASVTACIFPVTAP